jgi:hypothetical protein
MFFSVSSPYNVTSLNSTLTASFHVREGLRLVQLNITRARTALSLAGRPGAGRPFDCQGQAGEREFARCGIIDRRRVPSW